MPFAFFAIIPQNQRFQLAPAATALYVLLKNDWFVASFSV